MDSDSVVKIKNTGYQTPFNYMAILIYHVCPYIVQFVHKFEQTVVSQLENGVYPDQRVFNCATWVEYTVLFICTINLKYSDV